MQALQLLAQFGIRPRGIIHVGANYGQEFEAYKASMAETVLYIEPISKVFASLKAKVETEPGHHAIRALCSDRSGEAVSFNVASNRGESSSMLELGNHAKLHPHAVYEYQEELVTCELDELWAEWRSKAQFNLLVIDTQGADLLVLKGATRLLHDIEAIYVEVADIPLYEGGCTWPEIAGFLRAFGFSLKFMDIHRKHWGNAFFVKDGAYYSELREAEVVKASGTNLALDKPAAQSSQYQPKKRFGPRGGVNGKRTGTYGFHTGSEDNPWWQVDLQDVYRLKEVHLYNRLDMGADRAFDFELKLSEDGSSWKTVHEQGGAPFGGVDGSPAVVRLDGAAARFVRVQRAGSGYLHLDEVEVYGDPAAS